MRILVKPLVTEKLTKQAETLNRYGFVVAKEANKLQIKDAVEEMYNVSVANVNTIVCAGKSKTRYTKAGIIGGSTGTFKKAIVTLVEGDSIDFYSNI